MSKKIDFPRRVMSDLQYAPALSLPLLWHVGMEWGREEKGDGMAAPVRFTTPLPLQAMSKPPHT